MSKARPVLSDSELLDYSKDHVFYEIRMLVESAELQQERIDTPSGPMEPPYWNCAVDSFAIHVRNVVDFLYPRERPPRSTDVVADDFFPSGVRPAALSNNVPAVLDTARWRADKQVSHLTTDRLPEGHPEKAWNCTELLRETFAVLSVFAAHAAPTKLHPDVTRLISVVSHEGAQKWAQSADAEKTQ